MYRPCSQYAGATKCGIEMDEWLAVDALIKPWHTVIEFGGRYGTTSCRLARATNNTGNVVVVEPDKRVWETLLHNRDANRCNVNVVLGTVSKEQLRLENECGGYECRFQPAADPTAGIGELVPQFSLAQVEDRIGSKVNAAVIDCEGCISQVLTLPGFLDQLDIVLIEEDMAHLTNYSHWLGVIRAAGFSRAWHSTDDMRIDHSAWIRSSATTDMQSDNFCTDAFLKKAGYFEAASFTEEMACKSTGAISCPTLNSNVLPSNARRMRCLADDVEA